MKPLFCLLIFVSCGVTPTDNSEKATEVKTFKILDGHYAHAQDKHHFYDNGDIIKNYNSQTTTCQRDERGRPISLSNKTGIYQLK
jgi:hypothetical protein